MSSDERVGAGLAIDWTQPSWKARRRAFISQNDEWDYASWTDRLAALYGARTAFVLDRPIDYPGFSGTVLSYADVSRLIVRMGIALRRLGVRRGDRVGLVTMNRIEMAFCNFAAARIGAIPVPMNFMLRSNEVEYIVNKAGVELVVCDRAVLESTIGDRSKIPSAKRWAMIGGEDPPPEVVALREAMEDDGRDEHPPVLPASSEDTAILFFTSGTTGFPKGAEITHAGAMLPIRQYGRLNALRPKMPRELSLLVMPVAHAGGYSALMLQLATGVPAYFMSRFDPSLILDNIERHGATMMSGTPAMYRMLLEAGARERDLTTIRYWAGGADAFTDDLVRTFRDLAARRTRLGRRKRPAFLRGYGMAEANSYVALSPPFTAGDRCLGWVLPPVKYRIVDEEGRDVPRGEPGELVLRGENVTREYWRDPPATEAAFLDGWFRTGDVVRRGKWRMLYFVERSADIIKSGGYKIAAAELEQVLLEHPDVEHACAVGIPHRVKSEQPVAAVVLRAGAAASAEDVLAWARERIAPYKCPRRIVALPSLPFTFSLKPKRREVREQLNDMLVAEGGELGVPREAAT